MIGFEDDVKKLFRPTDVVSMKINGRFDLSKYEDVVKHADGILKRLELGDMPCDGAWPQSDIDIFKNWIADGKLP